jgi:tRNA dimethylallyltransferase
MRDGRPVFLVGATAVGKTAVGIELAERLGAEILSVDARQVYRQLSIGTAKPTADECARVRHHLINLYDPVQQVTAADFARRFGEALDDLRERGCEALAVGGSGLYVDACLGRLDAMPPADEAIRERHRLLRDREGDAGLHRRLAEVDPSSAARLSPADFQRVSRALEVRELTGKPLSELQHTPGPLDLSVGPPLILLVRSREELYARIESRARAMLAEGLLEEVAALLEQGVAVNGPAFESIGYAEFARALRGETSIEEASEAFIRRTRRYAKRQETWFRNRYTGSIEIQIDSGDTPQLTADKAYAAIVHRRSGAG